MNLTLGILTMAKQCDSKDDSNKHYAKSGNPTKDIEFSRPSACLLLSFRAVSPKLLKTAINRWAARIFLGFPSQADSIPCTLASAAIVPAGGAIYESYFWKGRAGVVRHWGR